MKATISNSKLLNSIWFSLMLLTLLSAYIAESDSIGPSLMIVVGLTVSLKGYLVIDYFMDLRHAPQILRRLIQSYLMIIPMLIVLVSISSDWLRVLTQL